MHSDLDCRIVSKKDFQTSFLGQEHLVGNVGMGFGKSQVDE